MQLEATIIYTSTFRGCWRISASSIPQCEENQRAPGECTGFAGGERRLDGRNKGVPRDSDKSLCSCGSHLAHSFFLCCLWCSAPGLVGPGRWAGSPEILHSPLTSCRLWRLKVCALLWQWCVAHPRHGKEAKWDCEAVTFIKDNKWTASESPVQLEVSRK